MGSRQIWRPRALPALLFPEMMTFGLLLLLSVRHGARANSMHLARLCRNIKCGDPERPLLEYDEGTGRCDCRPHPCWDDNGLRHQCKEQRFPHLVFDYSEEGKLNCACSSFPQYTSVYISRDKCS